MDDRRGVLRAELIRLATLQIARGGTTMLRARDLAATAGCAVGAIYNVFADLTGLILAVNRQTFAQMEQAVATAVTGLEATPPEWRLILLARAYVAFAAQNHNLWRALFNIDLPDDVSAPEWYSAGMARLHACVAPPVAELFPDLAATARERLVRGLFASIHGIAALGLQRQMSGLSREEVKAMTDQIILRLCDR